MMDKQEEKIQEEIIRRALKQSDFHDQEKLKQLQSESTLETLQEITGLTREELEKIAEEVRSSQVQDGEGFFSIKNQIIFVIVGLIIIILLIWALWVF